MDEPPASKKKRPEKRGPYFQYLRPQDSDEVSTDKIPRTTLWRLNKRLKECGESSSSTATLEEGCSLNLAEGTSSEDELTTRSITLSGNEQDLQQRGGSLSIHEEASSESDDDTGTDTDATDSYHIADNVICDDIYSSEDNEPEEGTSTEGDAQSHSTEIGTEAFNYLRTLLQTEYSGRIEESVLAGKGEILLMCLSTSKKHSFSNEALLDVFNIFNSMFRKPVLPHSRYMADKLLFCSDSFLYHYTCNRCSDLLEPVDSSTKIVKCGNCECSNNISNLCEAPHFVTVDLRVQLELLFKKAGPHFAKGRASNEPPAIHDLYEGSMYQNFIRDIVSKSDEKHVSLSFCVDGSPLYTSSNTSIWPVSVILNELPPDLRMKNVLLVGLWFGSTKPKMDVLLEPLSDYWQKTGKDGILLTVDGKTQKVFVHLLAACVDSGARMDVQGTSLHNGEFGCNWCLNPGIRVDRARKYIGAVSDYEERTAEEIVNDGLDLMEALKENRRKPDGKRVAHIRGVRSISPLINVKSFDIVRGMIVDPMHARDLGCTRRLTKKMLSTEGEYYVGDPDQRIMLDGRIKELRPPKELRRLPRQLAEFAHWKAREFENWLLFYSLPCLHGILSERYLKHWHLYVESMSILSSDYITEDRLLAAEAMLASFVDDVETLYGIDEKTFNVHLLSHMISNVKRWGPLWAISGYCFESFNGELKKKIHANRGIQKQVCRSLAHDNARSLMETTLSLSDRVETFVGNLGTAGAKRTSEASGVSFYGSSKKFKPSPEEQWLCENNREADISSCVFYEKAFYNGYVIETHQSVKSKRTKNCIVRLSNAMNDSFQIEKIVLNEHSRSVFALGRIVKSVPFIPVNINAICSKLTTNNGLSVRRVMRISEELELVYLSHFKRIEFSSVVGECHFLITVPYLFNKC